MGEDEPVYVGGPVQPGAIVMLAEFLDPDAAGILVARAASACPRPMRRSRASRTPRPRRRVFAGYAGWGEGQLDAEIEQGDWIAHDPSPQDIFTRGPRGALERGADAQGRQIRADRAHAAGPERQLTLG